MMLVGHVLNYVPDHVLDHMIIGLVTTALQQSRFAGLSRPSLDFFPGSNTIKRDQLPIEDQ